MSTSMVNIALEGARMNALLASVIELDLCDAIAGIIRLSHRRITHERIH